jgi:hypothetical protein
MIFDPKLHTKEYLLRNPAFLDSLIKNDPEFMKQPVANDFGILKKIVTEGFLQTAAHRFALYQKAWITSESAKNPNVLSLKDKYGKTVAHTLASSNKDWCSTDEAKSLEILLLENDENITVAHTLAEMNSEWVDSDAAKDEFVLLYGSEKNLFTVAHSLAASQKKWMTSVAAHKFEILSLQDRSGETVAHNLLNHVECLHHKPLFDKRILSLVYEGKFLAEDMISKFKDEEEIPLVAMKLLEQGVAYKQREFISKESSQLIFDQANELINECSVPEVRFKYAIAIYSSIAHYAINPSEAFKETDGTHWQNLLNSSIDLIKGEINKHPHFLTIDHQFELFCEPAKELLTHLSNELEFKQINLEQAGNGVNDIPPALNTFY